MIGKSFIIFTLITFAPSQVKSQLSAEPTPVSTWSQQWSTANCTGSTIPAICADIENFTYVPLASGGGYIWSASHPTASGPSGGTTTGHFVCRANGASTSTGRNDGCGLAVFQIYCMRPAYVQFTGEGQAEQRRGNDDSFWIFPDNNRREEQGGALIATGYPLPPAWSYRRISPAGPPWFFTAGVHTLGVAEREDGTRLRRVTMTAGYPDCQFGAPPQLANWTADQVYQRLLALETASNDRVSAMSQTIASLNSTIVSLKASVQMEVATQTSTITAMQSSAAAVSNAVASFTTRLGSLQSFAVSAAGTTPAVPEVSSTGSDITVKAAAGGTVRILSDECQSDLCALAGQVSRLTEALRQV